MDPASIDEPTDESKQELDADSAVLDGKVHRLAVWTSIGSNAKVYMPPTDKIAARYMAKFSRAGGKLIEDEDAHFGLENDGQDLPLDGGYYARFGEATPQNRGADAGTDLGTTTTTTPAIATATAPAEDTTSALALV